MTEPTAGPAPTYRDDDKISLFAIATVILRWRWQIIAIAVIFLLLRFLGYFPVR